MNKNKPDITIYLKFILQNNRCRWIINSTFAVLLSI